MSKLLTHSIMIAMMVVTLSLFTLAYLFGWNPSKAVNSVVDNGKPFFTNMIQGSFEKPLSNPIDIVIVNENLYVTDNKNDQIQVFEKDGTPKFIFGKSGQKEGEFQYPYGITADSKNKIYVGDLYTGKISIFNTEGKFLKYFKTDKGEDLPAKHPGGLRIVNDKLYMTDINDGAVFIYDLKGKCLLNLPRQTYEGLEVMAPNGIYPDKNGNIYLSDTGNNRVLKLDSKGKWLLTINGSPNGKSNPELISQRGITLDKNGNVLIADKLSHRILSYTSNGKENYKVGSLGSGVENFSYPNNIFVKNDGTIYVVDSGNNRIMEFQ